MRLLATLLLASVPIAPAYAQVDVVLEWNAVALQANVIDHNGPDTPGNQLSNTQGPPASARVLAIVHAAMFDAYNSIDTRYTPYFVNVAAPSGASTDASVAQAAHDTLAALIPAGASVYSAALAKTLSRVSDSAAAADGRAVGAQVAAAILAHRAGDAAFLGGTYTPTGAIGNHDVDPQNPLQSFISPDFGQVPPFGVSDISRYRAPTPPPVLSLAYVLAYYQVLVLGRFRGGRTGTTAPTGDETYVVANYWSYNGSPGTGTPPRLYNQIARQIATARGNEVHENARLFALINISLGDAGITAWDSKYTFNYWRPVLGIRQGNRDRNFLTIGFPSWRPLGGSRSNPFPGERNFTPPFPAYTSGHATFGATVFKTLANFYQTDDIRFTFVSDEWNGSTLDQFNRVRPALSRSFRSLSHAAAENAASRVFNGVHWSYDGTEGVRAGNAIANDNFDNILRPIGGQGDSSVPDEDFEGQIKSVLRRTRLFGHKPDPAL